MNLIIDQGNTNIKFFVFSKNKIIKKFVYPINSFDLNFFNKSEIDNIFYSTVSGYNKLITKYFDKKKLKYFTKNLKIPVINKYRSKTLGLDRIAAIVGANYFFPQKNVLSIDIGSAITYDFINEKGEYEGGNISPGLKLRYKSLNDYTKNLPLLNPSENKIFLADNTKTAIIAGVQNGILFEMEKYIEKLMSQKKCLKVILTGGDINFFEKKIKYHIFAQPNLIAYGLNVILKFNNQTNK